MTTIDRGQLVEHLAALVPDGAVVGIGGSGLSRKPMTLVRALAATGRRDLRIVVFLGSVDVEVLLGSEVLSVSELHTAGVALDAFGLAPRYRAARQSGDGVVVPWSEGTLHAALEASARGIPSVPTVTSPDADLVAVNPWLRVVVDPFVGTSVVQVRAFPLDVALIHAHAVGPDGDIHIEGDLGIDDVLVRAAAHVVVSTETTLGADAPRRDAAISRVWVDDVVELPGGSWPTGTLPDVRQDDAPIARYAASKGSDVAALLVRDDHDGS
jgi:glutaconate CoA-transferase, subunit A